MRISFAGCAAVFAALATAAGLSAEPLSRKADIDFFREAASRDLNGFATRSDGRLVAGPSLTELKGPAPAELLWCLASAPSGRWWVGTGPEGRIVEVTTDAAARTFRSREIARVDDAQVFALLALPNGDALAGTSPKGGLFLLRGGKTIAQVRLPADSVLTLAAGPSGTILAGTGNPGRIYSIDLAGFAAAGLSAAAAASDDASLARHGIRPFGRIADRNVRRIVHLSDGRWAAGSAPAGNVYLFEATGGAPRILEENREAEVTDLLPDADGGFEAAIVYAGSESHERTRDNTPAGTGPAGAPALLPVERFTGRGVLARFPRDGFPEVLSGRSGEAFYALGRQGSLILAAGGEQGQLSGYDLVTQTSLNFAGSTSARLTALARDPAADNRWLVVHNNGAGFALLDFSAARTRSAETRSLDLGQPGELGSVRFDRLRALDARALQVSIRMSNSSEEREGWGPWTELISQGDGWRPPAGALRGRYFRIRVTVAGAGIPAELGRGAIYYLPQNRRPQLQDFHFLSPNFGLVVPGEPMPQVVTTLGQVVQGRDDDKEKRKERLMAAQVVPLPGNQIAFWNVTSTSGDNVGCTLSLRHDGDDRWFDVIVDSRDGYASFDIAHLPEGVYVSRLTARQLAPRPAPDRMTAVFQTDDLVVDHTPPAILDAEAHREGTHLILRVHGRDALSLLDSIEADFNNGTRESVDQPADGARDGREETFVLEEPLAKIASATSVEVTLYDAAGNASARRIDLK